VAPPSRAWERRPRKTHTTTARCVYGSGSRGGCHATTSYSATCRTSYVTLKRLPSSEIVRIAMWSTGRRGGESTFNAPPKRVLIHHLHRKHLGFENQWILRPKCLSSTFWRLFVGCHLSMIASMTFCRVNLFHQWRSVDSLLFEVRRVTVLTQLYRHISWPTTLLFQSEQNPSQWQIYHLLACSLSWVHFNFTLTSPLTGELSCSSSYSFPRMLRTNVDDLSAFDSRRRIGLQAVGRFSLEAYYIGGLPLWSFNCSRDA
jgi:hypothetical protein